MYELTICYKYHDKFEIGRKEIVYTLMAILTLKWLNQYLFCSSSFSNSFAVSGSKLEVMVWHYLHDDGDNN